MNSGVANASRSPANINQITFPAPHYQHGRTHLAFLLLSKALIPIS